MISFLLNGRGRSLDAVLEDKFLTGLKPDRVSYGFWFHVRERLAGAVDLGLDRLRAVDGAGQFRTVEGDDGKPAEDQQSGEGD